MLASHQELQKANSFILPEKLVTLLYHANHYDEIAYKDSYDYVNEHFSNFQDILDKVIIFAEKYTSAPQKLNQIIATYEKNQEADRKIMAHSFVNLMQFNALGAPADFKFFDTTITRKRYTSLTEIWQSTIIYQSVTGLYETRRRMADLWDGVQ